MNVSYKWLKSFVDIGADPKAFSHKMNMTGTEIKGFSDYSASIDKVVVAKILKIEQHPNADKLSVCTTDIGAEEPIIIITGAKNMKEGDLVPAALDGSTLPTGQKIKTGKLRGLDSFGMFCSVEELGITVNDYPGAIEDGLLILNSGTVGEPIEKALGLDDIIFEADIVTNRPDCLSMIGVAREAAATFGKPVNIPTPEVKGSAGDVKDYINVTIDATDLCYRYCSKVVTDVKIEPSPDWMVERLRSSGVRSINNIVDITNYVMLEYGQPMHAFDYSCVDGKHIIVRRANENEIINTLDEQERSLDENTLVICDEKKPIALAGIMGGENSEIKDTTTTVVFESATFFGAGIRRTAKRLGMRTESSARFEKGLDSELAYSALMRACELVEELGAGKVVNGLIDEDFSNKEKRTVKLECDWINHYIAVNLSREEIVKILESLSFKVEGDDIIVPSFRSDIENKYDIAEEIARIYGYDNIPSETFKADVRSGGYTPVQIFEQRLGEVLRASGLSETQTYSFVSPKSLDKIHLPENSEKRNCMKLINPLGEDTSIMRTTALPSALEVLALNYSRRASDVSIYEIATTYIKNSDESKLPDEKKSIVFGCYGSGVDFYTLKGIVENVAAKMNVSRCDYVACKDNPSYHPGRTAVIKCRNKEIGIFGQIHPTVAAEYGIDVPVYCGEIDFDMLYNSKASDKTFKPLPKYPAVTRDLALICDENAYSANIEVKIIKLAGKCLENIKVFDVYKGAQVEAGKKSIAYALTLRSEEKTLQDTEIDEIMNKVIKGLEKDGITLRK